MNITKIWFDLDGVLSDFDGAKDALKLKYPWMGDSKSNFWKGIHKVPNFYSTLEVLPGAYEMLDFVRDLNIPMGILTALPVIKAMPEARDDKKQWVRKHFGQYPLDFQVGPYARDKKNHCHPGHVLIDDKAENIDSWNAAGGIGIFYTNSSDVIEKLRYYIEEE